LAEVSEVLVAIVVIMEAVSTSETSAKFYRNTQWNIPEDGHLQCLFDFF
jgi:hypothetical protein